MNFYAFHIGDYASATAHLSIIEDGVYRRLLDVYYTRETPIPADLRQACRLVRAQTDAEREAVEIILGEFFVETDEGWRHARCDKEIARANEKKAKASQSANTRWGNARKQAGAMPSESVGNANARDGSCERMESACEGNAPNPNPNPNPNPKKREERASPRGERLTLEALPDDWREFCNEKRPDLNPVQTFDRFRDYWQAKPGKDGVKLDWFATWRNWVRDERQRPQRGGVGGSDPAPSKHTGFQERSYVGTDPATIDWA